MSFGRDKGIQLCIEWRPYNNVLSTIDIEEDGRQQRCNCEFDVVAMRKDTSVHERDQDHGKELSSEVPEVMAIRTLRELWTQHCEEDGPVAAWELHTIIYNIRRTNQANKDACFKLEHCYWSYLPDRNRPQRTSVYGGIRRIYAFDEQERPCS